MFSSYIDRQKSKVGSSEKSQKVHSANWKEEVQFRKELECLNRQERQRVSRISIDQRLAVNRFHNKLSKSVVIAKNHEKAIVDLDEKRVTTEKALQDQPDLYQHMRTIRCLNAFPKPPVPKFHKRRSKSCEPPKKIKNIDNDDTNNHVKNDTKVEPEKDVMPRPMTALEKRNRLWERQLNSVTQRINRARSAPATKTSFYKVPEFSPQSLETVMKPGKLGRTPTRQRGMTYAVDMDVYRYLREKEIVQQRESVKAFLRSIEQLELIPWTPFDSDIDPQSETLYLITSNINEGANSATQQEEITRRTSQTRQTDLTTDKIDTNRRLSIIPRRQSTNAWT